MQKLAERLKIERSSFKFPSESNKGTFDLTSNLDGPVSDRLPKNDIQVTKFELSI